MRCGAKRIGPRFPSPKRIPFHAPHLTQTSPPWHAPAPAVLVPGWERGGDRPERRGQLLCLKHNRCSRPSVPAAPPHAKRAQKGVAAEGSMAGFRPTLAQRARRRAERPASVATRRGRVCRARRRRQKTPPGWPGSRRSGTRLKDFRTSSRASSPDALRQGSFQAADHAPRRRRG